MVIHQCVRKLQREHEMLRTDEVHSYNPLPTLWRGINNEVVTYHSLQHTSGKASRPNGGGNSS